MKKKYLYAVVVSASLLLPLGCQKNVLDVKDTTRITEDVLFKKPEDGIFLVNAIYDTFQHNRDYLLKSLFYNANFLSQDFFNWGADVSFNDYQFSTSFDAGNVFWRDSYIGIARANSALPIIAKMKADGVLTPELADRLTGEAYFLRGALYYYLACTFGGVPLELQTVTDDGLHPRNTQDEVFASISTDMQKAADLLPWIHGDADLGRATKGAALGYLGSALMWQKKYAEAVTAYKQLDGHYQLWGNYIDVHEYANQNKPKESLFEVQFDTPSGGKSDWNAGNEENWLTSFGMPEEVTTFGYHYANKKLYDSFQAGDTRKLPTIIGPNDAHPSPVIQIKNYERVKAGFAAGNAKYKDANGNIINTCGRTGFEWVGDGLPKRSGYYGVKFWRDPNVTGATNNPADGVQHIFGNQNVILLRYGEVLLSLAEAQFKSGAESDARITFQKVRDRAFGKLANPAVVVPPPVESDFMKAMLDEYRHELAGEMSEWFDLRRTGLHVQYIKDKHGITVPPGHDLLPVPAQQISLNPTLAQNPNY
ncbi:RagB/SusD family nutrient uptake outer membrane protein [Mucilaginibacter sp.]|uniref:RagB/SusD family nutrient uptake outer membrane protein n=1 Tax=Mucilaginibacter sp. TaxID=1882438 RepID=UPI0032635D60